MKSSNFTKPLPPFFPKGGHRGVMILAVVDEDKSKRNRKLKKIFSYAGNILIKTETATYRIPFIPHFGKGRRQELIDFNAVLRIELLS